jgi:uncharacterized protein YbaP (TraB family)
MRLLPRAALAALAAPLAFGCWLWTPPPESFALPPPRFPAPEIDVPTVDAGVQPTLWLAKSPIGSLYLFGSADPDPEGGWAPFGPEVEAAYQASHEIVFELDLGAAEPAQTIPLLRRYGVLRRPATLESAVSHDTWALLEERFGEAGRSTDAVQSLQPWLVSFAIANRAAVGDGHDPLRVIADRVQARAQDAGRGAAKPVVGLRTLESQFQMLSALPRDVQETLLRSALASPFDAEYARALLVEHLVYRPNEEMAQRLFEMAIDGKVRFVAVGMLHLVGDRGIPALLAQRGFRVSRLL